jgi:hypothetical protein
MTLRRTLLVTLVGTLAIVLTIGVVTIGPSDFFLPERVMAVEETGAVGEDAVVLKTGTFSGTGGHTVRGTVSLVETNDGVFLHFEDYEQTQGPDVFVYVAPSSTPDSKSEIAAGRKVRIDGGADDGESTKVGTFSQRLPEDVDPQRIDGVAIWCDRFATPFGSAQLHEVTATG